MRATADYVRGLIAGQHGSSTEAFDWFLRAARAGCSAVPTVALQAVIRAAMAAWESGRTENVAELRELAATIPVTTADEQSAAAFVEALTSFSAQDYDRAVPAFARAAETGAGSSNTSTLLMTSWAFSFLGRHGRRARASPVARERIARASGAVAALASLLAPIASWSMRHLAVRGGARSPRPRESRSRARPARRPRSRTAWRCSRTQRPSVDARRLAARTPARRSSLRGDMSSCSRDRRAEVALAFLDLAAARHEEALARFKSVFAGRPPGGARRVRRRADGGRGASAGGRTMRSSRSPYGNGSSAAAAYCSATSCSPGHGRCSRSPRTPTTAFQACLAMDAGAEWPLYQARTELAYGEFLRRARRKTEARVQLRAAYERFQRLGAAAWAERAAAELRATGETARRRDVSTIDQLTPQELQIARLVGGGGRNREIAGQLFLSPKTVEYHLRKVFQKLGIASRTELARLITSDGAPPELAGSAVFRTLVPD